MKLDKTKPVQPEAVLKLIEPGMSIFIGTGAAEPRTLVKQLMASKSDNLQDLTLVQLVSLGDAISLQELQAQKYRLKTFFSGWIVNEAINEGRVDLIPSRFSVVPSLIESGRVPIDAAFVQITPPDNTGNCSLGIALDAARQSMEKATIKVGEINPHIPRTMGDTNINLCEFDYLVASNEQPFYFSRWPLDQTFDAVAANVASIIEDGDCLAFSLGPLYEGLAKHLAGKKNLGIHSPFFTDPLMDLVKSGAVTNRKKQIFQGKSLASYAIGSKNLMFWLDRNSLVEFQAIDKVFSPIEIGRNHHFTAILPARKVDLSGGIALHFGKSNVAAGPGEAIDFVNGAELSKHGRSIVALPSRNRTGQPNILNSVEGLPNALSMAASVDMVVTEHGTATLKGRTVRERAQALIDIAHPDDRPSLIDRAKKDNIIYKDQIFLSDCAQFYPLQFSKTLALKNGRKVHFRAIKPSDEEEMRRLFYRFSSETVYYRYFSPVKTMPHAKMQTYVNVDYRNTMSVVGLVGEEIVAEARFVKELAFPYADTAFVVDEKYQGLGIASNLLTILIQLAKERGIKGFKAEVLASNKGMMRVFEKSGLKATANLRSGIYSLFISFEE